MKAITRVVRSLPRLQRARFFSAGNISWDTPMTEDEVHKLQATWGQAIKSISASYLNGGDFIGVANDAAASLYGYGHTDVLFKPTKAAEYPFRPTPTSALSYFVGGSNVDGGYSEDGGFAHNGGKGWSDVEFENVQIDLVQNMAIAMGHYQFTQATGEGAGSKTRVEFTFGYKRDAEGTPRIFLHHSSVPYNSAIPAAPAVSESIATTHTGVSAEPITEADVTALQASWGKAIQDVSNAYLEGSDFMTVAGNAAGALYGYGHSNVLFKPTKAAEHPFRPTAAGAMSYFVGGSNVEGGFSEDGGFAHNGGKGWSEVEFKDVHTSLNGPVAISMGHYIFTQASGEGAGEKTKVEFTFGYKRDTEGTPRIFLQHSSVPYSA